MARLVLLILMIGVLAIGSQVCAQPEWDLLVYGGYTNSTFSGGSDRVLGEDAKHAFTTGLGFQLRMTEDYGFEAGVRFARKGGGGTIDSTFSILTVRNLTEPIGNADITLDYVEIPLSFIFFVDASPSSYFRAYLGPSLNFLLRAHTTGEVDGRPIDQDLKSTMQTSQVFAFLGGSYVYEFNRLSVIVDARYSRGLTQVTSGPDVKLAGFEATVGIAIPLAREQ